MEGDEHQRRQFQQSGYTSGREYGQGARRGGGVSDRFRHTQQISSVQSPTSAPRVGGANQALGSYGYVPGQQQYTPHIQDASLQYQPEFPHDSQRQQQYPQDAQNIMYNLQQQAPPQSPYDPVQQYQPRQSAAIEVLSNQFGVSPYYNTGQPSSAPAPVAVPQQYVSTQFQQYQPPLAGGATLPSSYPADMTEYVQPSVPEFSEQPEVPQSESYDDAYHRYLITLKEVFEKTRDGRLTEAGDSLLSVTNWLLGHADELGLTRDDVRLHDERIKLWHDFNHCWLAVLQKQKDLTQGMLDTSHPPPAPQSMLREEFLERMGREITRHCDVLEKSGLVDYQMGVWEEEIINVLTDCLDLLEDDDDDTPRITSGVHALPLTLSSDTR